MANIEKILVVIDPDTPHQALERVAHFPRPLEAQLLLLICEHDARLSLDDSIAPAAVAAARTSLRTKHGKTLEALAEPLRKQGVDVLVDVRWDYPLHEAIIRKAVEWGADLVVKDTHYHSTVRRSIFSNTDWNLIRHCPVQLLLVKPRPVGSIPCIVAAVDPLHPRDKEATLDNRIMTCANDFAQLMGGQAHVLHVCETTPLILASTETMMVPIAVSIPELTAELETRHAAAVRALAKTHGIPDNRIHIRTGGTRQVLVELTDELRADVLVMGAVSRGALERFFVGSTAEAVLDRLSCDVLIVKPADFKP
jgi:universal stress protein E